MTIILRWLGSLPKMCRDALLAPAEDPREGLVTIRQQWQEPIQKTGKGLNVLGKELEDGFASINFSAGEDVLKALAHEYEQLAPVLERKRETDPLSVAHIPALADETHRQGLSVLGVALELSRAIHLPDRARLEEELDQLGHEMESLRREGGSPARVKMKEETLTSRKEILDIIVQQQLHIDELLHQADRCQASLHRTRIELAALRAERRGNQR